MVGHLSFCVAMVLHCNAARIPAAAALHRTPSCENERPLRHRAAHYRGLSAPQLLAARGPAAAEPSEGGFAAAGGLAAMAVVSEVVQYANTALLVLLLRRMTHTSSMAELAELVIVWFRARGWAAYPIYAAMLCSMQVLPLFSALIFIVLSGAIFGAVKGTAVVSLSLTSAAMICCSIGRVVTQRIGYDLSKLSPPAAAIDKAMAEQRPRTTLLLVLLIRLSPVVPFTFSNYLFGTGHAGRAAFQTCIDRLHARGAHGHGSDSPPSWVLLLSHSPLSAPAGLTSVSLLTLGLATLLGTLPSQAAYVAAGALGQKALSGQLSVPPAVLIAGTLATVAAVVLVGKVAQQTLANMEFDSKATKATKRRPSA